MVSKVFTGGDKLRRRLAEMARSLETASSVNVGFLEGATYPDGTPVAAVAAFNEFGVPAHNQPPRPFFRQMIDGEQAHWPDDVGGALKAADYDASKALGLMGEEIKGELQETIQQFDTVPLAPSTIARKGFDKQLIDTGHMVNSVDYEVKE